MSLSRERVLDYSKSLIGKATGVEGFINVYRASSEPLQPNDYISAKPARIALSSLGWGFQFCLPSSLRIASAETTSDVSPMLKSTFYLFGITADLWFTCGIPIMIATTTNNPLILLGSKAVTNIVMHGGLDLTRIISEKIKGSPLRIRA